MARPDNENITRAVDLIHGAKRITAFTGAGISVESGIPPFRGPDGLWSKYDPIVLDIHYFYEHPEKAWRFIIEIFYKFFDQAKPNKAHLALAQMEKDGYCHAVITQNIDNLHQEAGSSIVHEFHGNSKKLLCPKCRVRTPVTGEVLKSIPPRCSECGTVLKPDFVFFGESIPEPALSRSFAEAEQSNLFLLIGTTGEVQPAAMIPPLAKRNGARIIEVNLEESNYTHSITDVFLKGKASRIMEEVKEKLRKKEK